MPPDPDTPIEPLPVASRVEGLFKDFGHLDPARHGEPVLTLATLYVLKAALEADLAAEPRSRADIEAYLRVLPLCLRYEQELRLTPSRPPEDSETGSEDLAGMRA